MLDIALLLKHCSTVYFPTSTLPLVNRKKEKKKHFVPAGLKPPLALFTSRHTLFFQDKETWIDQFLISFVRSIV